MKKITIIEHNGSEFRCALAAEKSLDRELARLTDSYLDARLFNLTPDSRNVASIAIAGMLTDPELREEIIDHLKARSEFDEILGR